jgi:hypothetical protein
MQIRSVALAETSKSGKSWMGTMTHYKQNLLGYLTYGACKRSAIHTPTVPSEAGSEAAQLELCFGGQLQR